jgi:DNA/RNA endonuclease YhcR with UshA esterase domain
MKLSSFILGTISAIAVIAVVLLIFGVVNFPQPTSLQGNAAYNPANEVVIEGTVGSLEDFTCPIGGNEIGSHLRLKTSDGVVMVHLAAARVMRSQPFTFAVGDRLQVVGAKVRLRGDSNVIAREITRGNETFVLREHDGKSLLVQR